MVVIVVVVDVVVCGGGGGIIAIGIPNSHRQSAYMPLYSIAFDML